MTIVPSPNRCAAATSISSCHIQKPRVLLVAENGASGGVQRYCIDTAELFSGEACVVCLCPEACDSTSPCWLSKACAQRDLPLLTVPMPPKGWRAGIKGLRSVWAAAGQPLVHVNGRRGNFAAAILRASTSGFRYVTTVHGVLGLHDKRNIAYRGVDLVAGWAASSVIAVSADTEERLRKMGVPSRKLACVLNGLADTDMVALSEVADARRSLAAESRAIRVGFLGRLSPEKGVKDFVRMARELTDEGHSVTWSIAGDGPEREWVEERAAGLIAGGRLSLLGEIDDVRSFLAGIDILVMTSLNEGLPYSLLEAMASGCAVVAYGVGGIVEVIRDSSLGCLVHPQDYGSLKTHLSRLLNSRAEVDRIAAAGSAHARARFALRDRKAPLREIYDSVSHRHRKGGW